MTIKDSIEQYIHAAAGKFTACADQIHAFAEPSGQEHRSAAALGDLLQAEGFVVERGLKELPTAFRAVYGSGPVRIGFICEYDALAGLQQDDLPYPKGNGGPGHGCGHNLLGVGSAAAAIALKALAQAESLPVTLVVYGTPAEETLEGKTIMIRNGYFRDVDVVLGWHPHNHHQPGEVKHKAALSFTMTFHGRAAHACNCPENGRSALDAAELTNIGCNYLREHIDRDSYLHYCYLNGGERPNIVPDTAKLWYMARAYTYAQAKALETRIQHIAQGACMMTDTTVAFETIGETQDNKINFTLARLADGCMQAVGLPQFTREEEEYAAQIAQEINIPTCTGVFDSAALPADGTIKKDNGSTDLADVSQIVPTINLLVACFCLGTPMHSWAVTAQACRTSAHKGMLFAAKTLALMGARLATESALLQSVLAEKAKLL